MRRRVFLFVVVISLGLAPGVSAVLPTGFTDEEVLGGFALPVGFAFLPDGRVLLVEQKTADIELIRMSPVASATIFTVPDVQTLGGEQGLLGIAVDPGWPNRPYVYVYFDRTPGSVIYIRRYTASGALNDPASLAISLSSPFNIITDIPDIADNHNGGTLRFGPDGKLYASLGDDQVVMCDAQVLAQLKGKILRLAVSALPDTGAGPPSRELITPADNPYVGDPSANGRLVYCLGLRNPFRFTVDSATGEVFIGDVGLDSWEEMNRGNGGDNFGWPRREGAHTGPQPTCPGLNGEDPVAEYPHSGTAPYSIIAGPRYRHVAGPAGVNNFPYDYGGDLFFVDYYQGFIRRYREQSPGTWSLAPRAPGQPDSMNWATGLTNISDMQVGLDGAIWYLKQVGPAALRRIKGNPSSSVESMTESSPTSLSLVVTPNPTGPGSTTTIECALREAATIRVGVYDVTGQRVATVFEGRLERGRHHSVWNGLDARGNEVPSGVYFIRVEAGVQSISKKLAIRR